MACLYRDANNEFKHETKQNAQQGNMSEDEIPDYDQEEEEFLKTEDELEENIQSEAGIETTMIKNEMKDEIEEKMQLENKEDMDTKHRGDKEEFPKSEEELEDKIQTGDGIETTMTHNDTKLENKVEEDIKLEDEQEKMSKSAEELEENLQPEASIETTMIENEMKDEIEKKMQLENKDENIESEDEKKEFLKSEEELEDKIQTGDSVEATATNNEPKDESSWSLRIISEGVKGDKLEQIVKPLQEFLLKNPPFKPSKEETRRSLVGRLVDNKLPDVVDICPSMELVPSFDIFSEIND